MLLNLVMHSSSPTVFLLSFEVSFCQTFELHRFYFWLGFIDYNAVFSYCGFYFLVFFCLWKFESSLLPLCHNLISCIYKLCGRRLLIYLFPRLNDSICFFTFQFEKKNKKKTIHNAKKTTLSKHQHLTFLRNTMYLFFFFFCNTYISILYVKPTFKFGIFKWLKKHPYFQY